MKKRIQLFAMVISSLLLLLIGSCKTDDVPELSTSVVTGIGANAATSGGTITSNGGNEITVSGVCWSTSPSPTVSDNKTTDGTSSGSFTSQMTGLTPGTTYYVSAYATNGYGTGYGDAVSFTTLPFAVGVAYGGGVIFYINGLHGLIAATEDQSTGCAFGCETTLLNGAGGTAAGTGAQNTLDILAECADTGTAARICADLSHNGYTDWFLPSKDELNLMYQNRAAIGNFASYNYWSSSQVSYSQSWAQSFTDGSQTFYNKSLSFRVRAVRAF